MPSVPAQYRPAGAQPLNLGQGSVALAFRDRERVLKGLRIRAVELHAAPARLAHRDVGVVSRAGRRREI